MSTQCLKLTIIVLGLAAVGGLKSHVYLYWLIRIQCNYWKVHLHSSLHAAKAPTIALISLKMISAAYVFCRLMHRIHFLLEEAILL